MTPDPLGIMCCRAARVARNVPVRVTVPFSKTELAPREMLVGAALLIVVVVALPFVALGGYAFASAGVALMALRHYPHPVPLRNRRGDAVEMWRDACASLLPFGRRVRVEGRATLDGTLPMSRFATASAARGITLSPDKDGGGYP